LINDQMRYYWQLVTANWQLNLVVSGHQLFTILYLKYLTQLRFFLCFNALLTLHTFGWNKAKTHTTRHEASKFWSKNRFAGTVALFKSHRYIRFSQVPGPLHAKTIPKWQLCWSSSSSKWAATTGTHVCPNLEEEKREQGIVLTKVTLKEVSTRRK
jgi:hypothetical protein